MNRVEAWYSARLVTGLAVGFVLVILAFSSIPATTMPKSPSLWRWDKVIHATEYAILGALLFRVLILRGLGLKTTLALAACIASFFGVLDEIYQSTTPGRDSSGFDMLADATGACFACIASAVVYSRTRTHHGHTSNL